MALRSRSRATAPTSGPGRRPASDGRFRHRRPPQVHGRVRDPGRARHHGRRASASASAEELRKRAEALFGERPGRAGFGEGGVQRREPGKAPPGRRAGGPDADALRAETCADTGEAGGVTDAGAVSGVGGAVGTGAVPDGGAAVGTGAVPDVGAVRDAGSRWERVRLALRERMPLWLQTRCGLERRGVLALTVVLVAAAGLAVQHFWTGRTQSVPAPDLVRAAATPYGGRSTPAGEAGATGTPGGTDPMTAGTPGATPGAEIVVDVSGKVREPGVHRLPPGSRVADALRAAGGVRPGTDTGALNRARFLVDGEQVIVGPPPQGAGTAAGSVGASGGGTAGGPGAGPAAPVSLNTATVDQLDTLPGVGPVLAGHIVEYRTQHGGFRSVDELREVNGIGERRFADLRDLVRP
ncbi:ComEA family DNA-binding protein [Streptomyces sp. ISL-12]|uniref:ComEA family DNA-binding protein n=1 Tax=Streptomyces sp. ISL-12 TaxID=2819177 RepID=UPI001BE65F7D|nr:ComEA family DNA-binding protein [Streptomyces sp. ISL-12]MBT2413178.1 ComEA family DNA-binding protein [Streptomyces sp. ISL-12]